VARVYASCTWVNQVCSVVCWCVCTQLAGYSHTPGWGKPCCYEYCRSVPGKRPWALKHDLQFWPAWALTRDQNPIRLYRCCYSDPLKCGTWALTQLARDTTVNILVLIGHSLYMTRECKCLREGNILLIHPCLLPGIQRPRWDIIIFIIGASRSDPHTSDVNRDILFNLPSIIPYIPIFYFNDLQYLIQLILWHTT
jgi:hypothetical protein